MNIDKKSILFACLLTVLLTSCSKQEEYEGMKETTYSTIGVMGDRDYSFKVSELNRNGKELETYRPTSDRRYYVEHSDATAARVDLYYTCKKGHSLHYYCTKQLVYGENVELNITFAYSNINQHNSRDAASDIY